MDGAVQYPPAGALRACAPYWARTKGKHEHGVGYVKHNAVAGHRFGSWSELEAHLVSWMRKTADPRAQGTTGEAPLVRFEREEATVLRPINGRPPFRQLRELVRRVQSDCSVDIDGNSYSVPSRLIGESVEVVINNGRVRIRHAGHEVAVHAETSGRRQRVVDPAHFHGIAVSAPAQAAPPATLLRPLSEYEQLLGGGWQ